MIEWERVVALARELDGEHAHGRYDATKAERLARAVLMFQSQLTSGARDSRPPMAAAGAVEPPTG